MAVPRWLEVALGELQSGVAEVPGPASNPRIDAYLRTVGLGPDDETPWCAAFTHWCLAEAGLMGTARPNARSYIHWGTPVGEPRLGAITVLWRGSRDGWQGHVAFLMDLTSSSILLLGGNQGNRVSVAAYPRDRLLGMRWPI